MKRILFILLVTISCFKTFGQDSKMSFGIELKPTISWLSGNPNVGISDNRIGYSTGLSSQYSINSSVALKSGISFERKGYKSEMTFTNEEGIPTGTIDIYSNYDYLILPILGSICTQSKVKVYFNIGPYFGYLLNQKMIISESNEYPEQEIDGMDYTKKIDLGLSFGSGIAVPLNAKIIFDIGVNADLGLINTSKTEVVDNGSIKPNSLGLLFGLKYKI